MNIRGGPLINVLSVHYSADPKLRGEVAFFSMNSENDLILISPSEDMKEEILGYRDEHFAFGDRQVHGTGGLAYFDDFDAWLTRIRTRALGQTGAAM